MVVLVIVQLRVVSFDAIEQKVGGLGEEGVDTES